MRISLKPYLLLFSAFIVFPAFAPVPARAQTIWDLADDWSDENNPNGPWSYESPVGSVLTTHWDDWDPQNCCFTEPQPAWSNAQWPGFEHEALWFKTVSPTTAADLPIGTVGTHGLGGGVGGTGITWTSPITGFVEISGGTWIAYKGHGRNMDWIITVNGSPITQGSLTSSDSFTSANPFDFSLGSGGQEALTFFVQSGDVITLAYGPPTGFAEFVGVNFRITSAFSNEPIVRPNKGGDTGSVSVQIIGEGFLPNTTVKLARDGYPDIIPSLVDIQNDKVIIATFDLTNKSRGLWDMVLTDSGGQPTRLLEAFTIEEGRAPELWVDILGFDVIRPGRPQRYHVLYGNRGNVDNWGGLMSVEIPEGVEYKLGSMEDFSSVSTKLLRSLLFSGLGSGETRSIPLILQTSQNMVLEISADITPSPNLHLGLSNSFHPYYSTDITPLSTAFNSQLNLALISDVILGPLQPGGKGYIHYFQIWKPGGIKEIQVGIMLDDNTIGWSFPGADGIERVPISELIDTAANGGTYKGSLLSKLAGI